MPGDAVPFRSPSSSAPEAAVLLEAVPACTCTEWDVRDRGDRCGKCGKPLVEATLVDDTFTPPAGCRWPGCDQPGKFLCGRDRDRARKLGVLDGFRGEQLSKAFLERAVAAWDEHRRVVDARLEAKRAARAGGEAGAPAAPADGISEARASAEYVDGHAAGDRARFARCKEDLSRVLGVDTATEWASQLGRVGFWKAEADGFEVRLNAVNAALDLAGIAQGDKLEEGPAVALLARTVIAAQREAADLRDVLGLIRVALDVHEDIDDGELVAEIGRLVEAKRPAIATTLILSPDELRCRVAELDRAEEADEEADQLAARAEEAREAAAEHRARALGPSVAEVACG